MSLEKMEEHARLLLSNQSAFAFARQEALEKVASEIRAKRGSGTTAKAVELLEMRHSNIRERVLEYTAAGLLGVALAAKL